MNGEDLFQNPDQKPSRYCIYFYDWPIEKANKYSECFNIIEKDVKPEREKNNDKHRREFWWQFSRPTVELYETINSKKLDRVIVHARVSKTHAMVFVGSDIVFSDATVVFVYSDFFNWSILQSSIHEEWAWRFSSSLKSDRRYTPTDCFETFPFPQNFTKKTKKSLKK
jgi:hypothetical protein